MLLPLGLGILRASQERCGYWNIFSALAASSK